MMSCGIAPATPYCRSSKVYSPNSYVPQPARRTAAGPPGSVQRDIVQLGVTKQELHGPQVLGSFVDQRCLGPSHAVSAIGLRIESQVGRRPPCRRLN
jgi:hypothetical protein